MTKRESTEERSAATNNKPKKSAKARRGRRVIVVILVALFLLLCSASYLLVKLVAPAGDIASKKEANGIEWVRSIYGWGPGPDQQLQEPAAVAVDGAGRILVPSLVGNTEVYRFGAEGKLVDTFFGSEGEGRVLFPTSMAIGPDDSIYIVQTTQGNLLKLTPDGTQTVLKVDINQPTSVAVDDAGIVVGSKAGFAILNLDGSPVKIVGSAGQGDDEFDTISGIALDADGNIYVVDTYNNRISKYDREGNRKWLVKTGFPGNQQANEGAATLAVDTSTKSKLQTPGSAVIDGAGRLVVVDALDFTIAVFDTEKGDFIAKYGTFGSEDGKFMYPTSIAYDAKRDWFVVADLGNDRLQIVRLPGSSESNLLPSVRRTLTGAIRALFLPFILLVIAFVYWVYRRLRDKRSKDIDKRQLA